MANVSFRPRFKFETHMSHEEIVGKIKDQVANRNANAFKAKTLRSHVVLRYPKEQQHFWSPQLDVNLEKLENGKTMVRCLFGPAPTVWTMFMFFYAIFGVIGVIGLMIGFSQQTLNETPWAFWFAGVGALGAAGLFIAAQQGKAMAQEEMMELKLFLDASLECDCLKLALEE